MIIVSKGKKKIFTALHGLIKLNLLKFKVDKQYSMFLNSFWLNARRQNEYNSRRSHKKLYVCMFCYNTQANPKYDFNMSSFHFVLMASL